MYTQLVVVANANLTDGQGHTPLHAASEEGHLEVVQYLVGVAGVVNVNAMDGCGCTPLHYACKLRAGSNLALVQYLVETAEADVTMSDRHGFTPLHHASYGGRLDIVQFLVSLPNANVNVTDCSGCTPLHMACSGHSPRFLATVRCLETAGADVSIANHYGFTPLHEASAGGYLDIVQYLADVAKASVNIATNDGCTPLHLACRHGHLNIVLYLLNNTGTDYQAPVWSNVSPSEADREPSRNGAMKHLETNWPNGPLSRQCHSGWH
jgi:ankyrin repeat domain-containing protein 50